MKKFFLHCHLKKKRFFRIVSQNVSKKLASTRNEFGKTKFFFDFPLKIYLYHIVKKIFRWPSKKISQKMISQKIEIFLHGNLK